MEGVQGGRPSGLVLAAGRTRMGEEGMKRLLMVLGAAMVLAACSTSTPEPAPPPPPETPVAPPAIALPKPPAPEKDQCGLKEAQAFVGKNRTALPAPVDPSRWRVACTTCPVTMDYRADRLNILFNPDTGVVQQVKCG
ncbi:peptidase inhibitor I78 [Caulobacter endophyticus]|uniref:Peptidase inhibitor I78 n=2 Tax=Caulobacter endophyticus TaxID=2172652 RepID=A0A2T9JS18_9CAUL|nr:peptidase inhibitor I78 [Caulobacter endophyticus]